MDILERGKVYKSFYKENVDIIKIFSLQYNNILCKKIIY